MSFTQEILCMSLHVRVLCFFDIQQAFFSSYMQKNKHSGTVWNSFEQDNRERQYNLNCFSSLSFPVLQLNSENNLQTSSKLD